MTVIQKAAHALLRLSAGALAVIGLVSQVGAEELFASKRLTHPADRYVGIEGPAVDAAGNLYVVNFKNKGTIGVVRAGQNRSEEYAKLPPGSIGNGIRFDRAGHMYVADYKGHNVLVIDPDQPTPRRSRVYYNSNEFNQPNDLAIAGDGTLYASDPHFGSPKGGRIWRIVPAGNGSGNGAVMQSARPMGVTNGLDLSPDGKMLYVSESNTKEIWAYRIEDDKLVEPRLVKRFTTGELDGLRTDIQGRILVARQTIGKVTLLTADGTVIRDIATLGLKPSNLTFGGADGRTVYVTQAAGGFVEQFTSDQRGRETCTQPAGC